MQQKIKIYIIVGESSGDNLGYNIIKKLQKINNDIEFVGLAGPKITTLGIKSLFNIDQINLFGLFEIIPHIFRLKKLIKQTVQNIIDEKPDLLITIDSPGFSYRVAKQVKTISKKIKLLHIVAPSVWAYKPGRAKKFAEVYNYLFTLFPFEPDYFEPHGLKSICIGHPIFEQDFSINTSYFRDENNVDKDSLLIGITPGSRIGEIKNHLNIFLSAVVDIKPHYPNIYICIISDGRYNEFINQIISKYQNLKIFITKDKIAAFKESNFIIAKSGTNTLEIAACGTPMIVGYKLHYLTWIYIKLLIKIHYASLINIVQNRAIIPEFLQNNLNVKNLSQCLLNMIKNKKLIQQQVKSTKESMELLGIKNNKATEKAAIKIIDILNDKI